MTSQVVPTRNEILQHASALRSRAVRDGDHFSHLSGNFPLTASQLKSLCDASRLAFLRDPGLIELEGGLVVVGDIHGQFVDLLNIFERQGYPPDTRYLFLGDFIDRGVDGLEVMALLMAFKLLYPDQIFLLRGNHEASIITLMYGFYAECLRKLSEEAWKDVCTVFDALPAAAIIGKRMLCVHGGISPQLRSLQEINAIKRPAPLDHEAGDLLTDLVWSDPSPDISGWVKNRRGAGWLFGLRALQSFKRKHGLDVVVRAHETVLTGHTQLGNGDCVTVFSAPDYQGYGNIGATMSVKDDLSYTFEIYHPQAAEAVSAPQPVVVSPSETAKPGQADNSAQDSPAAVLRSPFEAVRDSEPACSSPPAASGVLDESSGMLFSYAVPASPFATAAVSPPASAFANSKTWSMEGMLSSLKSSLPVVSNPQSPHDAVAPAMVSVSSA